MLNLSMPLPRMVIATKKYLSSKVAIATLVTLFVLFNAIWIWRFRGNQILDIDEAGYLGLAISNYRALMAGGLPGWIQQVQAPSIQAPITTALASLLFSMTGPSIGVGIAVPLFAGAISIVGAYWLARCLMTAPSALLTAALIASCPIIVNYSRSFHFAMPATAMMTLALACMLRSRNFSSLLWASLFGICLGLLPLARTMTIGFLPGLIIGAAVHVAAKRGELWLRTWILACSLIIAITTAASWLLFSGSVVFKYLISFGYGNRAAEFGAKQSIIDIDSWLMTIRILLDYIYLPHACVLIAGLVAAAFLAIKAVRRQGMFKSLNDLVQSPTLPLLLMLATGLGALTSTQNKGSAFIAPLIPLMFVIAVYLIQKTLSNRLSRATAIVTGGTICIISTAPLANAHGALAYPWEVRLPGLGWWVKVTDGRGTIQLYQKAMLDAANEKDSPAAFSPGQPLSQSHEKAYASLVDSIFREIQSDPWRKNGVAFGFRHYLLNVHSFRLSALFRGADIQPLVQVEPVVTGDTVDGYYNWLAHQEASDACLLLTISGDGGQFTPIVFKPFLLQAAQKAGFTYSKEWLTPSGQKLELWRRTQGSGDCTNAT